MTSLQRYEFSDYKGLQIVMLQSFDILTPPCIFDREIKKLFLIVTLTWGVELMMFHFLSSIFLYYSDFILTVLLLSKNFKYFHLKII